MPDTAPSIGDIAEGLLKQDTAQQVRNNIASSAGKNADQAAEYQHLAAFVQVPVDAVHDDPDAIRAQVAAQRVDADNLAAASPATARYLTDANNAAKSHDDVHALAGVEGAVKALPVPSKPAPSFISQVGDFIGENMASLVSAPGAVSVPAEAGKGLAGFFNKAAGAVNLTLGAVPTLYDKAASVLTGKPTTSASDYWFKHMVDPRMAAQAGLEVPKDAPFVAKGFNMAGNLVGMMGAVAATGGGAAVPEAATAAGAIGNAVAHGVRAMAFPAIVDSVSTGNNVYQQTGDINAAMRAAQVQYLATSAAGVVPLSAAGGLGTRAASGFISGAALGESSRAAMNLVLPASMAQPFDVEQTILSGLAGTIFAATMGPRAQPVYHDAVRQTYHDAARADQAQQGAQAIAALGEMATSSKTRERDPAAFRQLVQDMTENGNLHDVYISAKDLGEALNQSGVTPEQLAAKLPDVAAQIHEATMTNGDVRIPVEDYATHIAGGPVDAALLPHLKTDAEGMTFKEAEQHFAGQQDAMKATAEKLGKESTPVMSREEFERSQKTVGPADKPSQAELERLDDEKQIGKPLLKERIDSGATPFLSSMQDGAGTLIVEAKGVGSTDPKYSVRLDLNAEELKAAKKAVALDSLAETAEEKAEAKQALQDAVAGAVHRALAEPPAEVKQTYTQYLAEQHAAGHTRTAKAASAQSVYDDILSQLDQLKRFNPETNKSYAALMRAFFETQAERTGLTAREVYDKSGLNIKGQALVDGLAQSGRTIEVDGVRRPIENSDGMPLAREFADQMDFWKWYGEGAKDTEGRPVVQDGKYINGAGEAREAQRFDQGEGNRGAYDPQTATIALLKAADLTTFLHEGGHFFLDTLTKMAAHPEAPEGTRADALALLKHLGVEGTPEMGALDQWAMMDVNEQRAAHEQFAEGFEKYLMEGKAPTIELQGLFSRFRSWLLNVYKSLTGLDVKLSPEIRGIMDRMLASDEAIREAEQTREYKKLFENTDDSAEGKSVFEKYLALGARATDEAIADMTGRSMRDMKWASNAKSKAIRELQKDAAAKRQIVRQDVTKEVMAEPVYQAWQFLSLRGADSTRANRDPEFKLDPKHVDTRVDNLYTAIAKMGGLNREELKTKWGVDHKDMPASGVFGKPVVRKSGGLTIERMAEKLVENHYLDEHDLREFEEKFDRQRAGQDQYSWEYQHSNGERPPAEAMGESNFHGKLSIKDLRYMYGEGDQVVKDLAERRMTSDKNGLDPDIVAEMVGGFADGREMIEHLLAAEKPSDLINKLTDQRMLEQHGELTDAAHIEQAANEAVHNETRARFIATGLKLLSKSPIPARQLVKAAREAAEASINGKLIRDLRPLQYLAAEARANKEALALAAKDPAGAVQAQRAALLNNQLFRAADAAVRGVQKDLKYLARFDKDTVRAKIDLEYREQIDALLDRHDLRKNVSGAALDKREALMSFVERMAAAGFEPKVPERLLNEAQRTHFKEMTVEEFGGLVDAVKSIDHLGRLKTELLDGVEKRELAALATEAADVMAALPQRGAESNRGLTRMGSLWMDVKTAGRSLQSSLLKMEQMMDWLDARNSNGVFNRVVFRRIADAGVKEMNMHADIKRGFDDLVHQHLEDVTEAGGKIFVADRLIDAETGQPQRFTKKELLALAGNMGNESNLSKLAMGEKWDPQAIWDFLHANMKKADWDFVAGYGKAMESLWPEKLAMSRRLGNSNPDKIAPRPFDTPHGRYEGWYWPMVYDPARAQDVAERGARSGDALFENIYSRANTDTGRMNTRNENYARPILLSLDVVPRVIKDEIHDIAYREAVMDADKFLAHPTVRDGIVSALSQQHYDQLRPWLQSIANDSKVDMKALKWFDRLAQGARMRATIVGLGFRVSTMIVHGASAALESVAEVGPVWMAKGTKEYFSNPIRNTEFIYARSGEMRNRMNEIDRDIREHLREIDLRLMDTTTSMAARGADWMRAKAYMGIGALDWISAMPTWMAAYNKGLAPESAGGRGLGEQDAIYFADKTVRNAHGGTGVKDQAAVQRGPEFFKLFTMFYTFWNHNVNRLMDTARMAGELPETYRGGDMGKFRGDLGNVILRTMIYTLGIQAMHGIFHPPKEGEESKSWAVWAAKQFAMAAISGIPVLRDIGAYAIGGKDYSATPAAGMVDAIGRSGKDALNAMAGREVSPKWVKHSVTSIGYVLNLPLGQPASAAQFLWDVEQGQAHPGNASDWAKGLMHGDLKKH